MRDTKYNSLDKVKKQIDYILSSELCGCRCAIYAHYYADNRFALFSYRIKGNNIHLSINIQTVLSFIEHNDWNKKVSLCFCAWYVSGYIRTLVEWEQKKDLKTYCDGVIFCEAIYDCFSNRKITVYVPYICEILGHCIKKMCVIDVLSEANALLRIKSLFVEELLQKERSIIDYVFDERMLYLKAPEVIYIGFKTPSLSVSEVITKIRVICEKNTELDLPNLPKRNDKSLIHNLIEFYKKNQDMFWIELLAHMVVCSPDNAKYIDDYEISNKMHAYIEQYEECLADDIKTYEYSKNKILMDNLSVMLKYIERGKRLLSKTGFIRKNRRTIHINY